MPAESERLRRRLGSRDWMFLGIVAAAIAAAAAIGLLVSARGGGAGARCVVYSHPNFTGGATYSYCGPAARVFCRSSGRPASVLVQCRRLGYLPTGAGVSRPPPPAAG